MQILTWNIQAAKGVDGNISVERIVSDMKNLGDSDVICLQEVMATDHEHQPDLFHRHFPEHTPVFGAAINRLNTSSRLQFGNLILCRLPLLQIFQHKLPQPAEPSARHMPRQAIEIIVEHNGAPIRVVTTHLEYFAVQQRAAQVAYLTEHHDQCMARYRQPSPEGGEAQFASLAETDLNIYCGDFNLTVDSEPYRLITGGDVPATTDPLSDCWSLLNRNTPHDPTCGIYDHEQWQEGAHCRDFFFVSKACTERVSSMEVDIDTAASDHQPLKITLD